MVRYVRKSQNTCSCLRGFWRRSSETLAEMARMSRVSIYFIARYSSSDKLFNVYPGSVHSWAIKWSTIGVSLQESTRVECRQQQLAAAWNEDLAWFCIDVLHVRSIHVYFIYRQYRRGSSISLSVNYGLVRGPWGQHHTTLRLAAGKLTGTSICCRLRIAGLLQRGLNRLHGRSLMHVSSPVRPCIPYTLNGQPGSQIGRSAEEARCAQGPKGKARLTSDVAPTFVVSLRPAIPSKGDCLAWRSARLAWLWGCLL